jgi:hypothetical protein
MAYCQERELGVFSTCLMGGRAQTQLLTGQWDEAADICTQALDRQRSSPVNRLNPLRVLGTIRGRRGDPDRTQSHLAPGDIHTLMDLDVRPQIDWRQLSVVSHRLDVLFEQADIDDHAWGG